MKNTVRIISILLMVAVGAVLARAQDTTATLQNSLDQLKDAAKAAAQETKDKAVQSAGDVIQDKTKQILGVTDSAKQAVDQATIPTTQQADTAKTVTIKESTPAEKPPAATSKKTDKSKKKSIKKVKAATKKAKTAKKAAPQPGQ
jgi:hypothetical protein